MTDTTKKARKRKPKGPFSDELLDQLLAQGSGKDAESLLGESGLIGQLKKQLAERMLAADDGSGNHRNGTNPKTVLTPNGALDLRAPTGGANTSAGCRDSTTQVIGLYARGMIVREIQGHLAELC
jgi:putative transposase